MSRSYHEIMEKIEVTDEMRTQILNNVSKQVSNTPHKVVTFPHFRKKASIAACIALLLIGGTMMKNTLIPSQPAPDQEMVGGGYGMEECASLTELSQKAGYDVKDIPESDIPFKVTSTSYTWCWNEFAQIVYEGDNNSLTYRKTEMDEDISGDYNQYDQVSDITINGINVTVKGNADLYYLATWHTKDYSYSISLNEGVTLKILSSIVQNTMD